MRKKAAALHAQDPARYPYYATTCRYFEALQPANQENTIQLGLMMNEELKKMVATLRQQRQAHPNVRLEYSDAAWKIDLNDLKDFNRRMHGICQAWAMTCWPVSVQRDRSEPDLCWNQSAPFGS